MKARWKALIVVVALIVVAALVLSIVLHRIEKSLSGLAFVEIAEPNLDTIGDGVYRGSYSAFPVSVTVDVSVDRGEITDVEIIEHEHGKGQRAEVLASEIVKMQRLNVDVVAGATYSSKVIMLAVRDALTL